MRMTGAYKAPLLQSPPTAKRPYQKLGISDSTRARKNIHRVDRLPQGRFSFHTKPAFTPSWGSMWQSSLHGCIYGGRSEEHTSELQSRPHLVCRLLLEKKKIGKMSAADIVGKG